MDAPDRFWVTDITSIKTMEGFAYLAVVIDLYSRRVIGWSLQSRPTTEHVLQALLAAVGVWTCANGIRIGVEKWAHR